ncbi:imelysin family protein [Pseudoalteromonas phenolica]|uniref:imelysin family protein n=1 Tax=Pseudoalteromonas phenolica TaxID=161398 RepID=UPI0038517E4C
MKTINTLMPTTIAVVLSLLLSGCGGGGSNEQTPTTSPTTDQGSGSTDNSNTLTEAQALEKITTVLVDDVILPSYQLMLTESEALQNTTSEVCEKSEFTEADLTRLQNAWNKANSAWQVARTIKFGPISDTYIYSQIQYMPIEATKLANDVESILIEGETFTDGFPSSKHQLQGLPAFEYVVFNQDEANAFLSSQNQGQRCAYLNVIASNTVTLMDEVVTQWQGKYGEQFKAGTGSFSGHKGAIEKYLTFWFEYLEIINDEKLKATLDTSSPGNPELLESPFAHVSVNNIKTNITALEQQFNGATEFGFDDLLVELYDREDVKNEITLHFKAVHSALDALENATLADLIATEAGRAKLTAVRTSITELRALMASDFVQVTDLAPGFNTNDGD